MYKPKKLHKYLKNAPEQVAAIYDSPKYADRYTVCLDEGLESGDSYAIGVFSGGGCYYCECRRGPHLGKLVYWDDLPPEVQGGIKNYLK